MQDIAAYKRAGSCTDKTTKRNFLGPAFAWQYIERTGSGAGSMMLNTDIALGGGHFLHKDK